MWLQSSMFAAGAADIASELRDMVSRMQAELGSAEVQVDRVIGVGAGGCVYQGEAAHWCSVSHIKQLANQKA